MKTYYAKPLEVEREWVVIDATDQVLVVLPLRLPIFYKGQA